MSEHLIVEKRLRQRVKALKAQLAAARAHAIYQDCGRMCDNRPTLRYRDQWKESERVVDAIIEMATPKQRKVK